VSHLASILFNARRAEGFQAFLAARGCEVMVATNPYEILRFKRHGRTNVVYKKRSGKLTVVGNDVALAVTAYLQVERRGKNSRQPEARPVQVPAGRPARRDMKRAKLRGSAVHKALLARDGDRCFYCNRKLGDDQSREHLLSVTHGGPDRIENQALAHHACNVKAAALPLVEKIKLRDKLRKKKRA